jgi:hypothetical protein
MNRKRKSPSSQQRQFGTSLVLEWSEQDRKTSQMARTGQDGLADDRFPGNILFPVHR